ncbi:MAG: hypothetical protein ABSB82_10770 [Terriglobia bacterium]|jgi:hypothetical protein
MKGLRISLLMAVLVGGLTLTSSLMLSKPEYAKKEGNKKCTYCHVKAGSKDLNDIGKCYQKNKHSLEGCESKEKK